MDLFLANIQHFHFPRGQKHSHIGRTFYTKISWKHPLVNVLQAESSRKTYERLHKYMVRGALRVQFKMVFRIRILYQENLTESNFFVNFADYP